MCVAKKGVGVVERRRGGVCVCEGQAGLLPGVGQGVVCVKGWCRHGKGSRKVCVVVGQVVCVSCQAQERPAHCPTVFPAQHNVLKTTTVPPLIPSKPKPIKNKPNQWIQTGGLSYTELKLGFIWDEDNVVTESVVPQVEGLATVLRTGTAVPHTER